MEVRVELLEREERVSEVLENSWIWDLGMRTLMNLKSVSQGVQGGKPRQGGDRNPTKTMRLQDWRVFILRSKVSEKGGDGLLRICV